MIFGIGTDMVEINRIKNINSIDRFAKKILSKNELDFFNSLKQEKKITYLSKQFAGKEAVSKAIGTGITKLTRFKDIDFREFTILMPLLFFVIFMGIYPSWFSNYIHISVCSLSLVTLY